MKFTLFILLILTTQLSFAQDNQVEQCEKNVARIIKIKKAIESAAENSDTKLKSIKKMVLEASNALENLKRLKLEESFDEVFVKSEANDDESREAQEDKHSAQIAALAVKAELIFTEFKDMQKTHRP